MCHTFQEFAATVYGWHLIKRPAGRAIQNKKKQILSEREDFSQDGPCLMTGYLGFEVRIRKKSKQDRKRSLLLF